MVLRGMQLRAGREPALREASTPFHFSTAQNAVRPRVQPGIRLRTDR